MVRYTIPVELYHAVNRGVEKRTIFLDSQDYARYVHNLYECNDTARVQNLGRSLALLNDLGGQSRARHTSRKPLVQLHGWCLMRNHFHLLLSEIEAGGIPLFLMKVNVGYAKYFNEKYQRTGALLQGKTKQILIAQDSHYLHILNYIHLNPLDYSARDAHWRTRGVPRVRDALAYLDAYKWSSYRDYCGWENFPSLLTTDQFKDVHYRKNLGSYLQKIDPNDWEGGLYE